MIPAKISLAVGVCVLIGLLLVSDLAKGAMLSLWYRPQVNYRMEHTFDTLNTKINDDSGVLINNADLLKDCNPSSGYPSGGKAIFTCTYGITPIKVEATNNFIDTWRGMSPMLEKYIIADGWKKGWSQTQRIDTILNDFRSSTGVGVDYNKQYGSIECSINFSWIQPQTPNVLTINEQCAVVSETWGI